MVVATVGFGRSDGTVTSSKCDPSYLIRPGLETCVLIYSRVSVCVSFTRISKTTQRNPGGWWGGALDRGGGCLTHIVVSPLPPSKCSSLLPYSAHARTPHVPTDRACALGVCVARRVLPRILRVREASGGRRGPPEAPCAAQQFGQSTGFDPGHRKF